MHVRGLRTFSFPLKSVSLVLTFYTAWESSQAGQPTGSGTDMPSPHPLWGQLQCQTATLIACGVGPAGAVLVLFAGLLCTQVS